MELTGELKFLADVVVNRAGPRLLELRDRGSKKEWKAQTDFRTEADLEIEQLITSEMRARFPGLAIYSEESGDMGGTGKLKLILDPIDGTIIWSSGAADYFSVAAAFLDNERVVSSLIYLPKSKELFVAKRGEGAWEYKAGWHRLQVSNETVLQHAIVAVDHGKEDRQTAAKILNALLDKETGIVCAPQFLCSSYTLMQVARGGIQGHITTSAPCEDALPGMLLAIEAGAKVTTFRGGEEWSEADRSLIVACSAPIFEELVKRVDNAIK